MGAFPIPGGAVCERERRPIRLGTRDLPLDRGALLWHLPQPLGCPVDCLLSYGATSFVGANPDADRRGRRCPSPPLCLSRKTIDPSRNWRRKPDTPVCQSEGRTSICDLAR